MPSRYKFNVPLQFAQVATRNASKQRCMSNPGGAYLKLALDMRVTAPLRLILSTCIDCERKVTEKES